MRGRAQVGSSYGRHVSFRHVRQGPREGVWFVGLYNERGRSFGTIINGSWYTATPDRTFPWFEFGVAVGGDSNTVQVAAKVWSARAAIGVRIPRALTRSWVYSRREWSVAFGAWYGVRVEFGYDDGLDGMERYYRQRRAAGEALPWTRLATTNGWQWRANSIGRWLTGTSREFVIASRKVADRVVAG